MFSKKIAGGFMVAALAATSFSANAYTIFSGQDQDGSASTRASFTNSNSAQSSFLSSLIGVGTENFESYANGTSLNGGVLTFPGAGSATLSGAANVVTQASGTNGVGRYPHSGINFLETSSTNFSIAFGSSVAAFGFFGMDIGEFNGDLRIRLTLAGGGTQDIDVPNTINGTDGSALYFGLIASGAAEEFTAVQFFDINTGSGDIFAFDDMTVGSLAQVCRVNCNNIPEPGSMALAGLGLAGLAAIRRRKTK